MEYKYGKITARNAEEFYNAVKDGYMFDYIQIRKEEKAKLYLMYRNKDDADALYICAMCLFDGIGCTVNHSAYFDCVSKLAKLKDARGINCLGYAYYGGYGTKKNRKKELKCYEKAAKMGYAIAYYNLAQYYYSNPKKTKNSVKLMMKYYRLAAEMGYVKAQFALGAIYLNGHKYVSIDYKLAFHYTDLAAKQNYLSASYNMACIYFKGLGCEKDPTKALYYYLQAAKNNDSDACYCAGLQYELGIGTSINEEEALRYYKQGHKLGNDRCTFRLGLCHMFAIGTYHDIDEAYKYFKIAKNFDNKRYKNYSFYTRFNTAIDTVELAIRVKEMRYDHINVSTVDKFYDAIKNGYLFEFITIPETEKIKLYDAFVDNADVDSLYIKTCCLYYGIGISKDATKALETAKQLLLKEDIRGYACYSDALQEIKPLKECIKDVIEFYARGAELENAVCEYKYGYYLFHGLEMEANRQLGLKLLKKSADQGYCVAQNELGNIYDDEDDQLFEPKTAFHWFMKAAKSDYVDSIENVANMYATGKGVSKDLSVSFMWCDKALELEPNNAYVLRLLGILYHSEPEYIDYYKAFDYLLRSLTARAHYITEFMLGKCYVEGTGVSKDVYKGTRLIEKSASQNFGPAQAYMAKCYYVGLGVPKDINKAEEYIVLAIKQGYTREEILKSINNIDIEL